MKKVKNKTINKAKIFIFLVTILNKNKSLEAKPLEANGEASSRIKKIFNLLNTYLFPLDKLWYSFCFPFQFLNMQIKTNCLLISKGGVSIFILCFIIYVTLGGKGTLD